MADPLESLRSAQSIGPTHIPVQRGEMPLGPSVRALGAILGPVRSQILRRVNPAMETLGERLPEFAPRGGEAMLNVGRAAPVAPALAENPAAAAAFAKYANKGMSPPSTNPMTEFYRQNHPASFEPGGGRMTGQFIEGEGGLTSAIQALKQLIGR